MNRADPERCSIRELFGQNGGAHGRMSHQRLGLLRGEVPYAVDLFPLQDPAGKIVAQRAVGKAGEQGQMPKGIVLAGGGIVVHDGSPFG